MRISIQPPDDPLYTRPEASEYLRAAIPTLAKWASIGRGPKIVYVGRLPRYRKSDLDNYLSRNEKGGEQ